MKVLPAMLLGSAAVAIVIGGIITVPTTTTTVTLSIPKVDVTLSKVGITTLPANSKRTYGKFCNNNLQEPPLYFYVSLDGFQSSITQIPQSNCYETNDSAIANAISIFASTSTPSLSPTTLTVTTDGN